MQTKGKTIQFERKDIKLERKILDRELKPIWKQVKNCFKNGSKEKRLEQYRKKEIQSQIYKKQDKKCHIWLKQNLTPRKISAITSMIKQMVETKAWKEVRGLTKNSECKLCKEQQETVQHLLAWWKMLASYNYQMLET